MNLQELIDELGMSSAEFADRIGVSRAIVSHIQSGRNKPSLSVVQKIASEFPEVSLSWLINGQGPIVKNNDTQPKTVTEKAEKPIPYSAPAESIESRIRFSSTDLVKIVHYYKDGTFIEYLPKS